MEWINNYAWFGGKAKGFVFAYLLGVILEDKMPGYAPWLAIPLLMVFGWSRKTKAANDVWFRRNRGPIEDED